MSDLSLFDIERELHELLETWQSAETPEAISTAEQAIQAYAAAEVRKVDGIRRYINACSAQATAANQEAHVQVNRQHAWEARRDRLKAFCFDVMKSFGVKKLEGATGSLSIRGNGGVQPLVITDSALVPDELCTVTVTLPVDRWNATVAGMRKPPFDAQPLHPSIQVAPRVPSNSRIRAVLESPCDRCNGAPAVGSKDECQFCDGTGKTLVPGARLDPRGESLVVK